MLIQSFQLTRFTPFPFDIHPFVLYVCVYFCFANKIIYTIFLDSRFEKKKIPENGLLSVFVAENRVCFFLQAKNFFHFYHSLLFVVPPSPLGPLHGGRVATVGQEHTGRWHLSAAGRGC